MQLILETWENESESERATYIREFFTSTCNCSYSCVCFDGRSVVAHSVLIGVEGCIEIAHALGEIP